MTQQTHNAVTYYSAAGAVIAGLTLWQQIRQALNYIGDLTFTFQSSYHYRPGESLKGLALYRHKVGAFWAMVLNPWEKDHVE